MATLEVDGVRRVAWTPDTVEEAIRLGLLSPEDRYELIDGELYSKMGQGWPHRFAVDALLLAFRSLEPEAFHLSAQTDLRIDASYPQPDFHVLPGSLYGRNKLPDASETLLVVEVSDSSLGFDKRKKTPLYASAGVPVYWIVDLTRNQVLVHTEPAGDAYFCVEIFEIGDTLPVPFPGAPAISVVSLIAGS